MDDKWRDIKNEYDLAKIALWPRKGVGNWGRDEDNGLYHLWNAYHMAQEADEKEDLIYARILAAMATEASHHMFKCEKYSKLVKPSLDAYRRAQKAGLNPSDKELDLIASMAKSLEYELNCEEVPYEEMLKHIEGYEKLGYFQFHDSKPIHFEHDEHSAKLTLQFGVIVEFKFDGVLSIETHGDPAYDYIYDFYCYPCLHDKKLLNFDVDFYKIICSAIVVESISECDS